MKHYLHSVVWYSLADLKIKHRKRKLNQKRKTNTGGVVGVFSFKIYFPFLYRGTDLTIAFMIDENAWQNSLFGKRHKYNYISSVYW